jgi:hypothetical protein
MSELDFAMQCTETTMGHLLKMISNRKPTTHRTPHIVIAASRKDLVRCSELPRLPPFEVGARSSPKPTEPVTTHATPSTVRRALLETA